MNEVLQKPSLHLRSWRSMTLCLVVAAVIVASTACDKWPTWTISNETPLALEIFVAGAPGTYAGHEKREIHQGFPSKPDKSRPVYVVKAYEFVEGQGRLRGKNALGTPVLGGPGDLIFCRLYTWEELKELDLTIVVTQNVKQKGLRPDPEDLSCP